MRSSPLEIIRQKLLKNSSPITYEDVYFLFNNGIYEYFNDGFLYRITRDSDLKTFRYYIEEVCVSLKNVFNFDYVLNNACYGFNISVIIYLTRKKNIYLSFTNIANLLLKSYGSNKDRILLLYSLADRIGDNAFNYATNVSYKDLEGSLNIYKYAKDIICSIKSFLDISKNKISIKRSATTLFLG